MSWWRDVCRQLARLSHLLHPPFHSPFLFSLFHMLVVCFFTASQARLCFLLIASLMWTVQSTLTLLSILYLCFLFCFLGADPNTIFFHREVLLWRCPLWVQVVWSVLQWCFKPIQSYQEKLSAVDTVPFLLNFWFPKRHFFFLSIKWKCLLGTFLLIFFFFFTAGREGLEVKKKKKREKDWRNEKKKVGRVTNDRSRGGRRVQGSSARFGVWVPAQPSVKVHFFQAETWVKCAMKASR